MDLLELKLDDGGTVFVEVGQDTPEIEGSDTDTSMDVAKGGSGADDSPLARSFSTVSKSLKGIAETMENQLKEMSKRPDKVQLELAAEISSKAGVIIVSGAAKGALKLTLTWGK